MNNTQRVIAAVGLILFILMGAFPPWKLAFDGNAAVSQGYAFLLKPPQQGPSPDPRINIDRDRLVIQWITILVATIGFVKVFERKK